MQSLESPVTYWSGLTRFYVFMAVVLMVGPVRDALVAQRELAEQLRALNELRDALQHESLDGDDGADLAALAELHASLSRLDTSAAGPVPSG